MRRLRRRRINRRRNERVHVRPMPIPPRDDVRRPLALAVCYTGVLGVLLLILGAVTLVPTFRSSLNSIVGPVPPVASSRSPSRLPATRSWGVAAMHVPYTAIVASRPRASPTPPAMRAAICLAPGALFLLCSIFLARRSRWAVLVALMASGICCAIAVLAAGIFLLACFGSRTDLWTAIDLLVIFVIFALAFGRLVQLLRRSFDAIHHISDDHRGFEAIVAQPPP